MSTERPGHKDRPTHIQSHIRRSSQSGNAIIGVADYRNKSYQQIEFVFHISTLLPLLGIVAVWLPNIGKKKKATKLQ